MEGMWDRPKVGSQDRVLFGGCERKEEDFVGARECLFGQVGVSLAAPLMHS
jgi:hypothetical protein